MHELVDIISEILIMIQRESQKTLSRQVGHVESCQRHLSFKDSSNASIQTIH